MGAPHGQLAALDVIEDETQHHPTGLHLPKQSARAQDRLVHAVAEHTGVEHRMPDLLSSQAGQVSPSETPSPNVKESPTARIGEPGGETPEPPLVRRPLLVIVTCVFQTFRLPE